MKSLRTGFFVHFWVVVSTQEKHLFALRKCILAHAQCDSQLQSNHLWKKKILLLSLHRNRCPWAKKGVLRETGEEWKAWEGDGIWLSRLGFMTCIPRHLPTHPTTCLHSCDVDVILTRGQILICSIKCIRSELFLPGTTVSILFLNSVDLLLYVLFQDCPDLTNNEFSFDVLAKEGALQFSPAVYKVMINPLYSLPAIYMLLKTCLAWDCMERAVCVGGNILSFAFKVFHALTASPHLGK